jgi:hypothetical protein
MDLASQLVPAVVVLAANLLSGHSSYRWEVVTAFFGWGSAVSLLIFLVTLIAWPDGAAKSFAFQCFAFCLLTALSRDYERILRPLFPRNR